jgi:hypothetical protein
VLGPIFSFALAGLMVGYLFISPLSDRFGHRRMMIVSTIAFGLFTALNALTTNVIQLLVLRFLIGVGLGAAAPSAVVLTSEYNPKQLRATFVLLIYCGFSLGFVAAGGLAAWLLPSLGWRSLFWVGAAAPVIISVFLVTSLPESFHFLINSGAAPEKVRAVLYQFIPGVPTLADAQHFAIESKDGRIAIYDLFKGACGFGTVILWIVFALNLAEFYALQRTNDLDRSSLSTQHGGVRDDTDDDRRDRRGAGDRPGDGSARSISLARRPLSSRCRLRGVHGYGHQQFQMGSLDCDVLYRRLRQRRAEKCYCACGDFLSARAAIDRCRPGAWFRAFGWHRRTTRDGSAAWRRHRIKLDLLFRGAAHACMWIADCPPGIACAAGGTATRNGREPSIEGISQPRLFHDDAPRGQIYVTSAYLCDERLNAARLPVQQE